MTYSNSLPDRNIRLAFLVNIGLTVSLAASVPLNGGDEGRIHVDKLVDGHYEAIGGAKREEVNTIYRRGTMSYRGEDFPTTVYQRRPNSYHSELIYRGHKIITAFDGETAWSHGGRYRQPTLLDGRQASEVREEFADFDGLLVDYRNKGHSLELIGETLVDGIPAYHLRLTLASGNVQEWFLARDSYRLLKLATPQSHPQRGDFQRVYYFSNYQSFEGILLPSYIEREDQERVRAYTWTETRLNVELSEDLFVLPSPSP